MIQILKVSIKGNEKNLKTHKSEISHHENQIPRRPDPLRTFLLPSRSPAQHRKSPFRSSPLISNLLWTHLVLYDVSLLTSFLAPPCFSSTNVAVEVCKSPPTASGLKVTCSLVSSLTKSGLSSYFSTFLFPGVEFSPLTFRVLA